MSDSQQPANDAEAAPDLPTLEELAADPEIAALLDFEPVPRKVKLKGGWTPEKQREFLIRLAVHGSPGKAANEVAMEVSGARKLYFSPLGASFRASWDGMVELAKRRMAEAAPGELVSPGTTPPSVDGRRRHYPSPQPPPTGEGGAARAAEGEVLNEHGEYEDEGSFQRRGEEARDSIGDKLRRARRLFLYDISFCPAKRAAFEILTEYPVDWEIAGRGLPQPDEPWRKPRAREPDMLLTAEAGFLGAELVHGPDRKAELLEEINEWRAEQGLEPVTWREED